jgi:hypothetical protein
VILASADVLLGEILGKGHFSCIYAASRVDLVNSSLRATPADLLLGGVSPADSSLRASPAECPTDSLLRGISDITVDTTISDWVDSVVETGIG